MKNLNNGFAQSNRVLVVKDDFLFADGLEKMLSAQKQTEVIGVAPRDEKALISEIWRTTPHTVILSAESNFTNPFQLWLNLNGYGRLRIIMASINSNKIEIFDLRQATISHKDDLFAGIDGTLTM